MHRRRIVFIFTLAIVLAGCAQNGDQHSGADQDAAKDGGSAAAQEVSSDDPPTNDITSDEPADEGSYTTFPRGLDCEAVGRIAEPLTVGLYPAEETFGTDMDLWCVWGAEPGAGFSSGTDRDLLIVVTYLHGVQQAADQHCELLRSTASALDAIGGCVRGSIHAEDGAGAYTAYTDITLNFTCDNSVRCMPTLPASVTDEVAASVLAELGLAFQPG